MFEPARERGATSRMRLATCRSARVWSDGVSGILVARKEDRASIPETVGPEAVGPEAVGAERGRSFDDRITRKNRMVSRIAASRPVARAVAL